MASPGISTQKQKGRHRRGELSCYGAKEQSSANFAFYAKLRMLFFPEEKTKHRTKKRGRNDKMMENRPREIPQLIGRLVNGEMKNKLRLIGISDTDILTDDLVRSQITNYHIGPIDKRWILEKMIWPKDSKEREKYESAIVSLMMSIEPNVIMCLKNIIFISGDSGEQIASVFTGTELERTSRRWYYQEKKDCIIVNLNAVKTLAEEKGKEKEQQFLLRIISRALYRLGLSNPYITTSDKTSEQPLPLDQIKSIGDEAYAAWAANQETIP